MDAYPPHAMSSKPTRSRAQLKAEQAEKFRHALSLLQSGHTQRQSYEQAKLDRRTFNRLRDEKFSEGEIYLTPASKRGTYNVAITHAHMGVLAKNGYYSVESYDKANIDKLARYWSAVHDVYRGNFATIKQFDGESVTDIYGHSTELETDIPALRQFKQKEEWRHIAQEGEDYEFYALVDA